MKENIDIFRTIDITEDSLDALVNAYDCLLSKVSGRTRNVMRKWQMEFPDIRQFLICFMESTYEEMKNIRNCGNLTLRDMHALQSALISAAQTSDSLSETYHFSKPVLQGKLGLPESSDELLLKKKEALGYFPVFLAIQEYLKNRPDHEKQIIDNCMYIHKGQKLQSREDVAKRLRISGERVRQKRNLLIKDMSSHFKTYSALGLVKECPYKYLTSRFYADINKAEDTDFNMDFITWVLGSAFDDIALIGNPVKSIGCVYGVKVCLCAVPKVLADIFDFEAFILDVNSRMQERRIEEEKVRLRSLIEPHIKSESCENKLPEIEKVCRLILKLHFTVRFDPHNVILPSNSYISNSIIVEKILLQNGHPMTLDEIYDEFKRQYPNRKSPKPSIRGAINCNNNIVAISRSSTYSHVEWKDKSYRGGTLREFVCEYLDSMEVPIATLRELCEYIQRYRPGTKEYSLSSNLLQEKNRKFCILTRMGVRYCGYSHIDYGKGFKIVNGTQAKRRSPKESMRLLEEFIIREERYPRYNRKDKEETRLYNFVGYRRSAISRNLISEEDAKAWTAFEEKYRKYDIPRQPNH